MHRSVDPEPRGYGSLTGGSRDAPGTVRARYALVAERFTQQP